MPGTVAGAVAMATAPTGGMFGDAGQYLATDALVRAAWSTVERWARRMETAPADVATVTRRRTLTAWETAPVAPHGPVDMIRTADGLRPLTERETAPVVPVERVAIPDGGERGTEEDEGGHADGSTVELPTSPGRLQHVGPSAREARGARPRSPRGLSLLQSP